MADEVDEVVVEEDLPTRPEYMLSTTDNPYDPFTEWNEWLLWDTTAGYHTPGLLARVAAFSSELSDADQYVVIQEAINEIVRENVLGVLCKVKRGDLSAAQSSKAQVDE